MQTTLTKAHIRPAKLAEAVAGHIEKLILEGSLKPGDRLLAERELAEKLGVSRPSLREALGYLEARGLLRSGRTGTFIAPLLGESFCAPFLAMIENSTESTYNYLEFRGIVEGSAAYFAALRASDVDREMVHMHFCAIETANAQPETGPVAEADAAFHLAIYEASHNIMMLHVMSGLGEVMRRHVFDNLSKLYPRSGVRSLLLEQHRAVHDAIMIGDPEAARTAAEAHVSFARTAQREIDKADQILAESLRRLVAGDMISEPGKRAKQTVNSLGRG